MEKTVLYRTGAKATGGRSGQVRSEDGLLDLAIQMPKELGSKGGTTNPEQLFAAGYAACFDSVLNLVLHKARLRAATTVEVEVGLFKKEDESLTISAPI